MSGFFASLRALPLCFVIYLIEAGLSLLVSLPLVLELGETVSAARDASATAVWLERALQLAPLARVAGLNLALVFGALLLIRPWLQMAWFSSLRGGENVAASLATGTRLWWRALRVSLWVLLGLVLAATPFALAALAVSRWLAHHPSDRVRDLAVLGCLSPILALLPLAQLWHDLARARALAQGAFAAARRSARAALRPELWLRALLWGGAGWGAVLAAQLALADGAFGLPPLLVVGLLQAAALLRLVLRGAWLADALACAELDAESRADEFP